MRAAAASGPHLMFAGHTDVVPAGDEDAWSQPPFAGAIVDDQLIGRGAVDMKGAIACFVAAVSRLAPGGRLDRGSVSLLITGDEEGPSINGTRQAHRMGGRARRALGRSGRRRADQPERARRHDQDRPARIGFRRDHRQRRAGPCRLSAPGRQSRPEHDAPARRPASPRRWTRARTASPRPISKSPPSMSATRRPTSFPPARRPPSTSASATLWDAEKLQAEIRNRLERAAAGCPSREGRAAIDFDLAWRDRPSPVFLTHDTRLIETVCRRRRGRHRPPAGAFDDGRHVRRPLHQGLLPCRRIRAGGPDHAHGRRARAPFRPGDADPHLLRTSGTLGGLMPGLEEVEAYVHGIFLLARNRAEGFKWLDISADGFWRSFWSIAYAVPALAVSWASYRALFLQAAGSGGAAGPGFVLRLALIDVATWVAPAGPRRRRGEAARHPAQFRPVRHRHQLARDGDRLRARAALPAENGLRRHAASSSRSPRSPSSSSRSCCSTGSPASPSTATA